jgi:PAS domain S-box-containing protein
LFDTSDFPPRWRCGTWSDLHGWTHIVSDLAIFGAYAAIPLLLAYFALQRRDVPFLPIFWLFGGFILFCGLGHFVEATIFWQPWYRLSALVKVCTAIFSWVTVIALIPILPKALALPRMASVNEQLEIEISERMLAQERTREQAARIQAVLDNVADAIITINSDGIVESVNNAGASMFGYAVDELVGGNVNVLMPQPYRSEHGQYLQNYVQSGIPRIIGTGREVTGLRKDGSQFPIDLSVSEVKLGDRQLFTGLVRDITERKQAEEALRQSEARKTAMLDTAMDAVVTIDHEGKIVEFNPAAEQMFDFRRDDVLGRVMAELIVPPGQRGEHERGMARFLTTGVGRILNKRIELSALRSDGSEFPVEVAITRLAHEGPPLFTGYIRDITARKQAEKQLIHANRELATRATAIEHFNRQLTRSNEDLKQFAYVASHDLQEPLRKVTSFCEMLRDEYSGRLDGDALTYIDYAVGGALRMKSLITDLLDYSRVETQGKPLVATSAEEALSEAIRNLELTFEESKASVECDRLPVIDADRAQLVRLFQNLIGNAIKYRGDAPPRVHVWAEEQEDDWVFHVEDNGLGIDPKYNERIFVIFQRLHSRDAYAGTGIGLAVCKRIVERFGGRIWVESKLGEGSNFCFSLPKVHFTVIEQSIEGHENEFSPDERVVQAN